MRENISSSSFLYTSLVYSYFMETSTKAHNQDFSIAEDFARSECIFYLGIAQGSQKASTFLETCFIQKNQCLSLLWNRHKVWKSFFFVMIDFPIFIFVNKHFSLFNI